MLGSLLGRLCLFCPLRWPLFPKRPRWKATGERPSFFFLTSFLCLRPQRPSHTRSGARKLAAGRKSRHFDASQRDFGSRGVCVVSRRAFGCTRDGCGLSEAGGCWAQTALTQWLLLLVVCSSRGERAASGHTAASFSSFFFSFVPSAGWKFFFFGFYFVWSFPCKFVCRFPSLLAFPCLAQCHLLSSPHQPATMGHLEQWRSRQKIGMGKGARHCVICSNQKALIRKYELNVCRQCFRENAAHIGFNKLR
ncbi:ribosomal protein S29 [Trypanosoma conorhini]|uniref:Ribosomal protein S29 n=1 Tax=Trypanosoma conorhini TaxID=83891 RepID=A0A422MPA1_9TRYP|nr:ribosomal protein S29 [Trypanosoma conorhini]RNE95044.1 ribosomal protein S29 [Trypanosoma conorhini]